MKQCLFVLLAAGRSQRLGFDKVLTVLGGKPVLQYSLEVLKSSPRVSAIVVVTRKDVEGQVRAIIESLEIDKECKIVEGGKDRQDSVEQGLLHLPEEGDFVAIHDAARPLITEEMIAQVLDAAVREGGAVAAKRATDTLKRSSEEDLVEETLDRSKIWTIQTPQIFSRQIISEAYQTVQKQGIPITDDASAVEVIGKPVRLVETGGLNLKITHPLDWKLLELWMQASRSRDVREWVHLVCNEISPVVGYLPLLEKYGGDSEKFREYLQKVKGASVKLQESAGILQDGVRKLFP